MPTAIYALALLSFAARPAGAQEATVFAWKDVSLTLSANLWFNSWTTWIDNINTVKGDANYISITEGGVAASNLTAALRGKRFFATVGYLSTPDYHFPRYTDRSTTGVLIALDAAASRQEVDVNLGYMLVPQLGITVGYKGIRQKFNVVTSVAATGVTTAAQDSSTRFDGATLGVMGSAALGRGFSFYGNGAGGLMGVRFDPPPNSVDPRHDTAFYEAAELGFAWRASSLPLTGRFGYKFQRISTMQDVDGLREQRGVDVTSGYILGLGVVF